MLVNLEDHIQLVMLPETAAELSNSIIKLAKLIRVFEKLGFANDPLYGYLTVSPQNLGTALSIQCKFDANMSIYEGRIKEIESTYKVKITKSPLCLKLESTETLCPNYNETTQLANFL